MPESRSALILDMDGVVVDSELQWKLSEGEFLKKLIPHWRAEDNARIVGLGVMDLYLWLKREYGLEESSAVFLEQADRLARNIYGRRVSLAPGLLSFISDIKSRAAKLALATSSPRRWVDIVLSRFKLTGLFDAVISADEAGGKTKPAPDIHLLAAAALAKPPGLCAAIEDSALGIAAAKSAGMFCAAYRNGSNDQQDFSSADMVFASFNGLSYEALMSRANLA